MINSIPEKVTNFNVYDSANGEERLLGVGSEMTLPSLEAMSETISGAGIAGEIDSVTPGHFSAIDVEVPFNILTNQAIRIAAGDYANLTIRAAIQYNSASSGRIVQEGIRINIRGPVKTLNLGKVGVGKLGECVVVVSVNYLKVADEKNRTLVELDKLNFVYIVDGVDKLAAVRDRI